MHCTTKFQTLSRRGIFSCSGVLLRGATSSLDGASLLLQGAIAGCYSRALLSFQTGCYSALTVTLSNHVRNRMTIFWRAGAQDLNTKLAMKRTSSRIWQFSSLLHWQRNCFKDQPAQNWANPFRSILQTPDSNRIRGREPGVQNWEFTVSDYNMVRSYCKCMQSMPLYYNTEGQQHIINITMKRQI